MTVSILNVEKKKKTKNVTNVTSLIINCHIFYRYLGQKRFEKPTLDMRFLLLPNYISKKEKKISCH